MNNPTKAYFKDVYYHAKTVATEDNPTVGDVLLNRYEVLACPKADAQNDYYLFVCQDQLIDKKVVLKRDQQACQKREEILQYLVSLKHPHILDVYDYKVSSGQRYEVLEFCQGGSLSERIPLPEVMMTPYLQQIIDALQYFHAQKFVHGAITPTNLLLKDKEASHLVMGGLSSLSFIGEDEHVRMVPPEQASKLCYIAPEIIEYQRATIESDFYALGISLIELLTGESPFEGLNQSEILVCHLRGRIPLDDRVSERYQQLIKGLTEVDPEKRWGAEDISVWINQKDLAVVDFTAIGCQVSSNEVPFPGYPMARTPEQLAQVLDQFDAFNCLKQGDIRRWLFDYFDVQKANKVDHIASTYGDTKEIALLHLKYILDGGLPILIKDKEVDTLSDLYDLLQRVIGDKRDPYILACAELLNQGVFETWALAHRVAGSQSDAFVVKVHQTCRNQEPHLSMFLLKQTIDPTAGVQISDNLTFHTPQEYAALYFEMPRSRQLLMRFMYDGYLEEWLQLLAFDGWSNLVSFIRKSKSVYIETPHVGCLCVCYRIDPSRPIHFFGQDYLCPKELARAVDQSDVHKDKFIGLLNSGLLRAWLLGAKVSEEDSDLDLIFFGLDMSDDTRVEMLLKVMDPSLPDPVMDALPDQVHVGNIQKGRQLQVTLTVVKHGRGHLYGRFEPELVGKGVTLDQYLIEGSPAVCHIVIDTASLQPATYNNAILVKTNGGDKSIPISFTVMAPRKASSKMWDF